MGRFYTVSTSTIPIEFQLINTVFCITEKFQMTIVINLLTGSCMTYKMNTLDPP